MVKIYTVCQLLRGMNPMFEFKNEIAKALADELDEVVYDVIAIAKYAEMTTEQMNTYIEEDLKPQILSVLDKHKGIVIEGGESNVNVVEFPASNSDTTYENEERIIDGI